MEAQTTIGETVSLPKQVKIVKSMLDLLNETFPAPQEGIPSSIYKDREIIKIRSIQPPYFSAHQSDKLSSKNQLPLWWINSHHYNFWVTDECDELIDMFRIIALESGFEIGSAYQHHAGKLWWKEIISTNKCIFIGKIESTIIYE